MKKAFKLMAMLLCLVAATNMVGCTKEGASDNDGTNSDDDGQTTEEVNPLPGTVWVGYYSDGGYGELIFHTSTVDYHVVLPDQEYTDRNLPYTYSDRQGEIIRFSNKPPLPFWLLSDNVLRWVGNVEYYKQGQ